MAGFIASLLTGLFSAAAMFLVASGLSIIIGLTRIVNFAHGSCYMLAPTPVDCSLEPSPKLNCHLMDVVFYFPDETQC